MKVDKSPDVKIMDNNNEAPDGFHSDMSFCP